MRLKSQLKQLISIETLYMNLTLLILVPAEQQAVIETLDDIEELTTCYSNLGIDKVSTSNKKSKMDPEHKEARGVLMDFLTSMLTKP